jgi:hypothetical protein
VRLTQCALTVLIVFVMIGIAGCGKGSPGGPVVAPESTDDATTMPPAASTPAAAGRRTSSVPSTPAQTATTPASTVVPVVELLNVPPLAAPPRRDTDGQTPESWSGAGCGLPSTTDAPCPPRPSHWEGWGRSPAEEELWPLRPEPERPEPERPEPERPEPERPEPDRPEPTPEPDRPEPLPTPSPS